MVWITKLDLFLDVEDSDIELRIKTTHDDSSFVLPAHSLVLKKASSTFRGMLSDDQFRQNPDLELATDKYTALMFFKYLYTQELDALDQMQYVTMMKIATHFHVQTLVTKCEKGIGTNLTPYNVCQLYTTLKKMASESFLKSCWDLMLKSAFVIFTNNFHILLSEETMTELLKSDNLNAASEEQVAEAVWRWGRTKGVLDSDSQYTRNYTTRLVPLIRWSLIKIPSCSVPWLECMRDISTKDTVSRPERHPFEKVSLVQYSEHFDVLSNFQVEVKDFVFEPCKKRKLIRFCVNKPIFMTGVDIFTCFPDSSERDFDISVNGRSIEGISRRSKRTKLSSVADSNEDATCYFTKTLVEFHRPIWIKKSLLSFMDIKFDGASNEDAVSAPVYTQNGRSPSIPGSCPDVRFSVGQKVTGIKRVYFMVGNWDHTA